MCFKRRSTWGNFEALKATFPEVLPLCCALLISAAVYTRLHRVCMFNIKRNNAPLFHVLK